ncbi:anaerobic ribonucleoside-triphosphate reductase activating protein [Arcanobacterium haemolyticum]|nr:anaerobic ribonucleoside-triphosphate reductase activating protein [Arcanobacterium haemolyticum]
MPESRSRVHPPIATSLDDLAIAGFVPLSTVDWPDNLVTTVFLQGCPWRCPYCQNAAILDTRTPGIVGWDDVVELLERRRGLLDGVVFTGGEALRQAALVPAIRDVRSRGLAVGLHTAGAYPRRLAEALPMIDWVGLDIKALPADYKAASGFDAGAKGWESLDLVLVEYRTRGQDAPTVETPPDRGSSEGAASFSYEVRVTMFPGCPAERTFTELVAALRERGVDHLALQEARAQGTDDIFQAMAKRWDMESWRRRWQEMVDEAQTAGFSSLIVR